MVPRAWSSQMRRMCSFSAHALRNYIFLFFSFNCQLVFLKCVCFVCHCQREISNKYKRVSHGARFRSTTPDISGSTLFNCNGAPPDPDTVNCISNFWSLTPHRGNRSVRSSPHAMTAWNLFNIPRKKKLEPTIVKWTGCRPTRENQLICQYICITVTIIMI